MKKITNVCRECGVTANVLTCLEKYGKPPLTLAYSGSTFHKGICDVCRQKKHVTEARDFFHPNFSLIEKTAELLSKFKTC